MGKQKFLGLDSLSFQGIDEEGNAVLDEEGKPQVDLGSLSDIASAETTIQARNQAIENAEANGDIELANYLQNQLETELSQTFIKAGEDGIQILAEKLSDSKEMLDEESKQEAEKNITRIISNARALLKENKFFQTYGISSLNKEHKQYHEEFKSRLNNMYLKNRSDLRYTTQRIKDLDNDRSSLISNLNESLDATEEELQTNPQVKGLNQDINRIKELREQLKQEYKNEENKIW